MTYLKKDRETEASNMPLINYTSKNSLRPQFSIYMEFGAMGSDGCLPCLIFEMIVTESLVGAIGQILFNP